MRLARHPTERNGATVAALTLERADDAALIEQSWHEPEAFAGLYDRHASHIHRYVTWPAWLRVTGTSCC